MDNANIKPKPVPQTNKFENKLKNKWVVRALYLVLAVVLQLGTLSYLDWILAQENKNPPKETHPVKVVYRSLNLTENPLAPELMTVSPDQTLLALRDLNQLKIYDLITGRLVTNKVFAGERLTTLQWLPDRNRLIYALTYEGKPKEVVIQLTNASEDPQHDLSEDPFSSEPLWEYRNPKTLLQSGFQISLYSLDVVSPAKYEIGQTLIKTGAGQIFKKPNSKDQTDQFNNDVNHLADPIQTLNQVGTAPLYISLYFSTYSNLLYLQWVQGDKDYLSMVDIMKRIKDFRLPAGRLTNIAVVPKTGALWAEVAAHNGFSLYTYHNGSWKHHKDLEGYRLLGAAENGQLALAVDQQDWVSQVDLLDEDGNLHTAWAFQEPVKLVNLRYLDTGSLMLMDPNDQRTSILQPENKGATVYPICLPGQLYALAKDGKMLVYWDPSARLLNIYQEVQE